MTCVSVRWWAQSCPSLAGGGSLDGVAFAGAGSLVEATRVQIADKDVIIGGR